MHLIAQLLTGLVALIHLYILYLEMFAWTTKGKKTFKSFPKHLFEETKGLAANQGLYNGFLAAGLIWSLIICDATWSCYVAYFFQGCVMVAGLYGAITVQRSILYVQTMPAGFAMLFTFLSQPSA
ncbi:MAG: DUF1304 domain-containing protein [Bacteroidetes bacterium]|nr:DUF1304 domain-containing protein [Bacteroidota bacterium]